MASSPSRSQPYSHVIILLILFIFILSHCAAQTSKDIENFNAFVNDCLKSNPKSPFKKAKIIVKESPGMGRGTFATVPIAKDDIYMFMPWKCVMDDDKARQSLGNKISPLLDDFLALLLFYMKERAKGNSSFFARYINVLPRKAEFKEFLPYFWVPEHGGASSSSNSDDLELLKDSELFEGLNSERRKIKQQYEHLKRTVLDPFSFTPKSAYTFEEFEHAYFILNSRTIWVTNSNNKRALIPLLDNVNCKEGPDPTRVHTSARNYEYDGVVTKAPWNFGKSEQVFENYGSDNYNNFFYHGFSLLNNTHDCTYVKFSFLPTSAQQQTFCVSKTKVPPQLQEQLKQYAKAQGYANEWHLLKEKLQEKMRRYKTSMERDLEMATTYAVPARRQAIHWFLHEEKRVLKQLIALF